MNTGFPLCASVEATCAFLVLVVPDTPLFWAEVGFEAVKSKPPRGKDEAKLPEPLRRIQLGESRENSPSAKLLLEAEGGGDCVGEVARRDSEGL